MKLVRINTHPSGRDLHVFGVAWLVFGLAGLWLLVWKDASTGVLGWWTAFGVGGPLAGWVCTAFMRRAYLVLAFVAYPVGFVVSHVILAIIFYLLITPTGLLLRLCRPGFFSKQADQAKETYWQTKGGRKDARRYFKQY